MRVAVLVSGGGTNLQALIDALGGAPTAPARISRVISNRPDAGALERARRAGIPTTVLRDPQDPAELLAAIGDAQLVVLAGYLKLVPGAVVARFRQRMVNIHPALLPDFGGPGMYGRRVHEAVLAAGVTQSGATVHIVDAEYDHGPVVAQSAVPIERGDTAESLERRVMAAEPVLFIDTLRRISEGSLKLPA